MNSYLAIRTRQETKAVAALPHSKELPLQQTAQFAIGTIAKYFHVEAEQAIGVGRECLSKQPKSNYPA